MDTGVVVPEDEVVVEGTCWPAARPAGKVNGLTLRLRFPAFSMAQLLKLGYLWPCEDPPTVMLLAGIEVEVNPPPPYSCGNGVTDNVGGNVAT